MELHKACNSFSNCDLWHSLADKKLDRGYFDMASHIILVVFFIIYILSVILTRSIDKEDVNLLVNVEQRLGLNMKPIKKILKKFL